MKNPEVHIAEMVRELADRAGKGANSEADIATLAQEIMRKKRIQLKPEISGHPAQGRMMMDAFGNKAMVLPDGSVIPQGNAMNQDKPKDKNGA